MQEYKYGINPLNYLDKIKRFLSAHRVTINLENPQTIQDKIMWLNIYDINPLKTKCADKIQLRDYCKETLGEDLCIPLIKVYNSISEINWNELPNSFIIKCNHGSGMNIIVKDKNSFNKMDAISKLSRWMGDDFALRNGCEAHYHDIPHKVFAEKLMGKGNGELLDYKFWCFNGEPQMYTINNGNGHGDIMYYKMNGEEYNLYQVRRHSEYKRPQQFDTMVEYSRKLSKPFKFVRVDFYEIDGKIYLGEMTFVPGAGGFRYKNHKDEIKVGELLKLD